MALTRTIARTTLVGQATLRPDLELTRLRQADVHPPNGWRPEEGIILNGLLLPSEEHSDPHLPAGDSRRTWHEASHLTHEGYDYRNKIWKKKQSHQGEKHNQRSTGER